ncbi:MAG: ROK family protein [Christensenella sp.]|uniref:ROK family protein n=1 Tax=Christensenella sp. TaxID=1935934 RepID=UPI002B1F7294|nr:ROK family protein [Christensenella sp.]MEA5003355.1 ROK family protein [Christensenella sp.]
MKYYLGIDLGGTNIAAGVVDENYNIVARHSIPTGAHRSFEEIVADMARAAKEVAEKAGLPLSAFTSLGVGSPSCINPKTGLLTFANNMGWRNVPIIEELKKHIDLPVLVYNDADCAALGEALAGAAKGYQNVLMITLGTGVGGGMILDGRIFKGADGAGFEPGHTVIVYDGVMCTCGKKGCLESYGSATGLINQTKVAMQAHPQSLMHEFCGHDLSKVDGRTAFESAKQGDKAAQDVVDQYISYVAVGIGNLSTVLRPEIVIVGGGICNQKECLLDPLNEKLQDYVFGASDIGAPEAVAATLGNDAGIIGAALLEKCME